MDNESLATEMLRELKNNSKRWFIAFLVVLVLWFTTIGMFIWYINIPIDEVVTYEQNAENVDSSDIEQNIGE